MDYTIKTIQQLVDEWIAKDGTLEDKVNTLFHCNAFMIVLGMLEKSETAKHEIVPIVQLLRKALFRLKHTNGHIRYGQLPLFAWTRTLDTRITVLAILDWCVAHDLCAVEGNTKYTCIFGSVLDLQEFGFDEKKQPVISSDIVMRLCTYNDRGLLVVRDNADELKLKRRVQKRKELVVVEEDSCNDLKLDAEVAAINGVQVVHRPKCARKLLF